MLNLTPQVNHLSEAIHDMRGGAVRLLVALAGPPGSGKSTLSKELNRRLNDQKCRSAILMMDGFHLDNAVISERGLLSRKGSPATFDADGFVHMVRRLKEKKDVAVPVFDRSRDLAIAGAQIVPAEAEVVIVEGNYLLFDEDPWRQLVPLWSYSVFIRVPEAELRSRLIHRWLTLGHTKAAATRRAEANDIPNARAVLDKALRANVVIGPNGIEG